MRMSYLQRLDAHASQVFYRKEDSMFPSIPLSFIPRLNAFHRHPEHTSKSESTLKPCVNVGAIRLAALNKVKNQFYPNNRPVMREDKLARSIYNFHNWWFDQNGGGRTVATLVGFASITTVGIGIGIGSFVLLPSLSAFGLLGAVIIYKTGSQSLGHLVPKPEKKIYTPDTLPKHFFYHLYEELNQDPRSLLSPLTKSQSRSIVKTLMDHGWVDKSDRRIVKIPSIADLTSAFHNKENLDFFDFKLIRQALYFLAAGPLAFHEFDCEPAQTHFQGEFVAITVPDNYQHREEQVELHQCFAKGLPPTPLWTREHIQEAERFGRGLVPRYKGWKKDPRAASSENTLFLDKIRAHKYEIRNYSRSAYCGDPAPCPYGLDFVKKSNFGIASAYTYRGDTRPLVTIAQSGGFKPYVPIDSNLSRSSSSHSTLMSFRPGAKKPSSLVSTSHSIDIAKAFATNRPAQMDNLGSGHVFATKVDVGIKYLGRDPEWELAAVNGIESDNILAYREAHHGTFTGKLIMRKSLINDHPIIARQIMYSMMGGKQRNTLESRHHRFIGLV